MQIIDEQFWPPLRKKWKAGANPTENQLRSKRIRGWSNGENVIRKCNFSLKGSGSELHSGLMSMRYLPGILDFFAQTHRHVHTHSLRQIHTKVQLHFLYLRVFVRAQGADDDDGKAGFES